MISIRACDAHCHFFSAGFFEALARQRPEPTEGDAAQSVTAALGWDAPGTPEQLADRWAAELDRHGLARAALIASVPGDEGSVARAVVRHPDRFVGFFMLDPTAPDAMARAGRALADRSLRCVCLFPAMHRFGGGDPAVQQVFEVAAAAGAAVFLHCGVLTVGVRQKLGLPSRFEIHFGQPLEFQGVITRHPDVPVIIPHFGAGFFREALMLADQCPNVSFDTSSSNAWVRYHPGLTLPEVFRQALEVVGPDRLIFGTDSSFFPRGWQRSIWEEQQRIFHHELGLGDAAIERIVRANFERLFPR